jgi:alpha-methylacyl-CoA racemase
LGLDGEDLPAQEDESAWPEMKDRFAAVIRTRTRDDWVEQFADLDACVAPVLTMSEVADDDHIRARGTYVQVDGVSQPAPAPRFSRTPSTLDRPPAPPGQHTDEVLNEFGFAADEREVLRRNGIVA